MERVLRHCGDGIDFIWTGEGLGTQKGPLISLDLFHKQLRPRHQKIVDLAVAFHKPVMIHSCGISSWAFEDFIHIGIKGADTLQPEAANMAPAELAERFGSRLMFHGCIFTATIAAMSVEEVENEVCEIFADHDALLWVLFCAYPHDSGKHSHREYPGDVSLCTRDGALSLTRIKSPLRGLILFTD
jgi:hypothetical protein